MAERIDNIEYSSDYTTSLLYDNPTEFLVKKVVEVISSYTEWTKIFGVSIDPYMRMDYGARNLPALRVYNNNYIKSYESWFVEGDLIFDVILPASIRRAETQQLQDTLSAALLQQLRSTTFFNTVEENVPGLNELGKRVSVNKELGFKWGDDAVPLTQITVNFKVDLREWDRYLEETNRTKNSPFQEVLGDLEKIVTTIEGMRDDLETTEVELGISQDIET